MTVRRSFLIAFGTVAVIVAVTTAINAFNGGAGHWLYTAAIWSVIAFAGLALYWATRTALSHLPG